MQSIDPTILSGPNAAFIAELYARYVEDPGAVDPSWQRFFAELQDDGRSVLQDLRGASWAPRRPVVIVNGNGAAAAPVVAPGLIRRGGHEGGGQGFHPRAHADPRLSRARPSGSQSRSARA